MSTRRIADSPDSGESGQVHGWDPYQVWLTRVQQPRERVARLRRQERKAMNDVSSPDISETARLRALDPAISR